MNTSDIALEVANVALCIVAFALFAFMSWAGAELDDDPDMALRSKLYHEDGQIIVF